FYLHNPETQLSFRTRADFDSRMRRAFAYMEDAAHQGKIRWYGVATWDGFRKKGALDLNELAAMAEQEGGRENRCRFIQLPFNLAMVEAYVERPESVLQAAARLGIVAVASASLMQTHILANIPDPLRKLLPGLTTDAQRAIQFARSTPGISVALVGMSRREHV